MAQLLAHLSHDLIHSDAGQKDQITGIVSLDAIIKTCIGNFRGKVDETLIRSVITDAYNLSIKHHKGHTRKLKRPDGKNYDYFEHLSNVASILANLGYDHEVIAAGLLHDTIEDKGNLSMEELENRIKGINVGYRPAFESKKLNFRLEHRIWDLVNLATDFGTRDISPLIPRSIPKSLFPIQNILPETYYLYPELIILRGADRLHNLLTYQGLSEASLYRMLTETIQVYIPSLKKINPVLYGALLRQVEVIKSELSNQGIDARGAIDLEEPILFFKKMEMEIKNHFEPSALVRRIFQDIKFYESLNPSEESRYSFPFTFFDYYSDDTRLALQQEIFPTMKKNLSIMQFDNALRNFYFESSDEFKQSSFSSTYIFVNTRKKYSELQVKTESENLGLRPIRLVKSRDYKGIIFDQTKKREFGDSIQLIEEVQKTFDLGRPIYMFESPSTTGDSFLRIVFDLKREPYGGALVDDMVLERSFIYSKSIIQERKYHNPKYFVIDIKNLKLLK